jgi:hypothetical protein
MNLSFLFIDHLSSLLTNHARLLSKGNLDVCVCVCVCVWRCRCFFLIGNQGPQQGPWLLAFADVVVSITDWAMIVFLGTNRSTSKSSFQCLRHVLAWPMLMITIMMAA